MKKYLLTAFTFIGSISLGGGNQKSVVTQYMGAHAHVTITYNSPDVTSPTGENRKGGIWGELIPYGLSNLNFGLSSDENPSPWRAGANENTTISFSHDVEIEGNKLSAGVYGFHIIPQEGRPWTLIFSHNSTAWGSYFYRPEEDALRVDVLPEQTDYTEWLTYEFTDRQEDACTVALKWENISVPFTIRLPDGKKLYVEYLDAQMQNSAGFSWFTRNQAANYCLQNDVQLEEALAWQEQTISLPWMGGKNYTTMQTKAGLLMKLGRTEEGISTMMETVKDPSTSVLQVHQSGRQLIALGYPDKAMKIFTYNAEKNGDVWPVNVGLARGYAAIGKYSKALEHAKIALERAPDQLNKNFLTQAIEKLEMSEDIN
jgi:tetratricopeptide (TPR) repeat protein